MTTRIPHLLVATLALAVLPSTAQVSPEILPDGRVTFRCRAAGAEQVRASGQFGENLTLELQEDGLWQGTTSEPVTPGVFEYHFVIDGRRAIDGRNSRIKPQRWPGSSILHIPASPPAPWDLQDIPQGTVHRHNYYSKSLGTWRELVVYTPARSAAKDAPLPVLYLAHGYSDNQRTWTEHGMAHHILDALIHAGQSRPMIVVMPDAHALEPPAKKSADYGPNNTKAFCRDLLGDIIPFVDENYTTQSEPAGRAFAGLSMGGGHALTLALLHSDSFSHIGAFSAAPPADDLVKTAGGKADSINQHLKRLWVACGDKDFLFKRNEAMHASFETLGIKHDYLVTAGDPHSWPVWRRYLARFIPLLFQEQ